MKKWLALLLCAVLCLSFVEGLAATSAPKIEILDVKGKPATGTDFWIDCNLSFRVTLKSATAIEWKLEGPFSTSGTVDKNYKPNPDQEGQQVSYWKDGVLIVSPSIGPYDEAGSYTFSARGKVKGKWSEWGEKKFRIVKKGDLQEPAFTIPDSIELGEDLIIVISPAKDQDGKEVKVKYDLSLAWNDWKEYRYFSYSKAGTYTIPAKNLPATTTYNVQLAEHAEGYHFVWNSAELTVKPATIYKVTDGDLKLSLNRATKTATVTGPADRNVKSIKINATYIYKGDAYKITAISAKAFKNCKKLTKAEIGKNIREIGASAFSGCKKLETIVIRTSKLTAKNIGSNAFKTGCKKGKVKCPKSKVKAYQKILRKKGLKKGMEFVR